MKSRFRKLTAWLLTSAMLFTLLPATAFAMPATHSHAICGAAHTDIGDHTGNCEDITWTAWDGTTDFPGGNVYLSADVTLEKTLEISSETVNLCLNGKVLRISENASIGIEVSGGAELNLCDCQTTEHKFIPDESGLWVLNEDGTKIVSGGVITGGNTTVGSAICSDGTLRLYGGNIVGNHGSSRAVVHSTGAEFSMYGGSICGNTGDDGNDGVGLCLWNRTGKHQIRGGKIYENTAEADDSPGGVGVYVSQGNLTISGAVEIYDNKRGTENDNIYVAWNRSNQNEYSLIIDGKLTNTTPIGVWARYEDIIIKADGTNVTDLTEYMNNFTSDNTGRELQLSFDKTNIKLLSPHSHAICGAETCTADHNLDGTAENHQSVTWTAWDGTDMDEGEAGIQLNAGNYYLTKDVIVTSDTRGIHPVGNVALCLNGHTISCESGAAVTAAISFDNKDDCLTLTDCAGTGLVTRPADDYSITIWISAGKLEQYGGTIQATSADIQSTAIWNQNNGTFSQYGGKIESESIGIHSLNESTVNLYGGTIEAAIADIYVRTEGAITLSSEISKPAEPYSIVADFDIPFTSGWNTYMSSATVSDYFIPYSSEYIIKKNASTGELVFDVKPTTYTVKFDANGGSGTMANQTITLGEATALSENTFTKTGYFFEGWATTADGAKVYNDQQSVTDLADAGESITLFAVWNKIPANAPAITSQPQGFEGANALTYANIGADKKLSVETNAVENEYTVTYQWYKNTTDSKDGAAAVGTEKDLAIENDLNAGDYYYYCKITVTRKDNGESTSVDTDLVKVTVNKAAVAAPTTASKVYTGSTLKADISETADYTVTTNNGGITVGQYEVVLNLKDSANYKWSDGTETAAKTIKFEIKKATANAITGLAIEGWTFGESAKTPSASATFGTPAFTYVGTDETNYAENATPPANAGTYKVIAKVADTTNYAGASDEKTFTIAKATPSVSAPTAKTGLVYNGADKALVSAGTTSGGEMQYSLDGSTWATEIPQGNSAGSYTVYYKVVGGMNYNDNAGGTVQVAIAKAQIAKPSADSRTFTYTGSEQTYIVTENDKYTVSGNKRTNAGTQNVTVALKDKNNYEWADRTTDDLTFTFNIGRADAEITINGDTSIVKTYGDIWELPTASSTFGTVRTNKTVENLKNAGTYTVTYSVIETENYNRDTKTVSVTVNPLPVNITWENTESLVYDGNEKTINPVVANKVSGDTFNFAFDGTTTLTATEKGTYTATVTDVGNANYTLTGGTNLTKTWAIAEAANEWTTPLSITGWIYGGTANEPTAAAKFGTPVYTYANSIDGAYTSDVPASAGTWYVKATVAGATSYAEISDTKEFVITEKELNADSITAIGDVTFTGEEIKPAVEVRDGNTILVLGTDYEVAYQDNANAGTAKVIITFKGNYKGTPEKSFIILPKKNQSDNYPCGSCLQ